jgi:ribosomal protein S3
MRITTRDERVFQGTALQIVRAMKELAFGVEYMDLAQYVDWVVGNARKFKEIELEVKGESDEELAAALVAEMIRTGLTRRM